MSSLSMAARGLRKRKTRTALTVSGIAVGVAMILVLFSLAAGTSASTGGLLRNLLSAEITVVNGTTPSFGGQGGGFTTPGNFSGGAPGGGGGGFFIENLVSSDLLNQSLESQIGDMTNVYAVSAELSFVGSIDNTTAFVYGIEDSYSATNTGLNVVNGTDLNSSGEANQIVLESSMASSLNVTVGSAVDLSYNSTDVGSFTVVGIYSGGSTFGPAARSAYITLAEAQNITDQGGLVSQIYVKANDANQVSSLASTISSAISGIRAETANNFTSTASSLSSTLTSFFEIIGLVALAAGGFGVVNTMMMSVTERTREIGTLKAIGAKGSQIMKLFMSEALIIGLIGGLVGVTVGIAVGYAIPMLSGSTGAAGRAVGGLLPGRLTVTLTAYNLGLSFAAGTLVGLVAGILPAWRASKLDPVEALRHV